MPRRSPRQSVAPAKSRSQVGRALAERRANAHAKAAGHALPHPNLWDALDPTKAPADASDEQIRESYRRFRALCPPPARRRLDP